MSPTLTHLSNDLVQPLLVKWRRRNMGAIVGEWLHLVVRWMHILAGIMWIGTSIFFNWLDSHLDKPRVVRAGVEGELWMVHSGGFYQVEKKLVAPSEMPPTLHWFKWEAYFTWITGMVLLGLVYYAGGGALLVDSSVSDVSVPVAIGIGLGTILLSWFFYDTLWRSPIGESTLLGAVICFAVVIGAAYGFGRVLSGRAAYIHCGAMMGTWMVGNVWMRIIPAQKALVEAVKEGRAPDALLGKRAKQRSRHNNYMTYPVVFIMLSNHFPGTYGSAWAWAILGGLMLLGASVRHFENTGDRSPGLVFALLGVVLVLANSSLTGAGAGAGGGGGTGLPVVAAPSKGGPSFTPNGMDAKSLGTLKATVTFAGTPPAPKEVQIPANCAPDLKGPVFDNKALVKDGKLQNAFVWLDEAIDWKDAPPNDEVLLDQRACTYGPHVLGAQVGQRVTFLNSDPVFHNVRTIAKDNPPFNEAMATKDMRLTKTFGRPEIMVNAKCDVHPWMSSFIGVVAHPYFAVSNERGEVTLENVPAGEHTLAAWHELFGKVTAKVTTVPKETTKVDLAFKGE
jgi:uncharacterized membrane protein/plastocyanin